jgi:hypothetical protein
MLKVKVFSGEILIGIADLCAADPPMGVAAGSLIATEAYAPLRPAIDLIATSESQDWSPLALRVVAEDGSIVDGVGGISIGDFIGNEAWLPELTIAGIDCASGQFEAWFGTDPAYVAYYKT